MAASPQIHAELSPEIVGRLAIAERETINHANADAQQARWRRLIMIPYLVRALCAVGLIWYGVGAVLMIRMLMERDAVLTWADMIRPGLNFIVGVVAVCVVAAVSTWAARYCNAKAQGKL